MNFGILDQKLLVFWLLVLCPRALVDEQQKSQNSTAYGSVRCRLELFQFTVFCRFRCKLIYVESSEWVWMKLSWISIDFPLINFEALELKSSQWHFGVVVCAYRSVWIERQRISDQIIGRFCWLQLKSMILRPEEAGEVKKIDFDGRQIIEISVWWTKTLENINGSKTREITQVQSDLHSNISITSNFKINLQRKEFWQPLALSVKQQNHKRAVLMKWKWINLQNSRRFHLRLHSTTSSFSFSTLFEYLIHSLIA